MPCRPTCRQLIAFKACRQTVHAAAAAAVDCQAFVAPQQNCCRTWGSESWQLAAAHTLRHLSIQRLTGARPGKVNGRVAPCKDMLLHEAMPLPKRPCSASSLRSYTRITAST